MDLKAIEYVAAIAEAKTISQAAKNLFISQPALSQYLAKVERELETALFVRNGNTMSLTSAGEIFIREGRFLLLGRDEMLVQIQSLSHRPAEILRFGISPFYSKYYLPMLLLHYREHYPNVKLDIVEMSSTELENEVLAGRLDFCFIPAEPVREGLIYQTIGMEEIMIAIPGTHPVNKHSTPSPGIPYLDMSLIANEPFVELIPALKFSKMSRRILRHFGITPNVVYETTNWDTVCMLVAKGIGVGFLPEVLIHMHVHEPNFYRIAGIDSTRIYAVVYAKGKHLSHAALKLIDIFVENLKHMGHS